MNYLVIGASAGLGRALSKKLAAEENNLILISRDNRDLKATASDLLILYNINVVTLPVDLSANTDFLSELEQKINIFGGIDGIFFPIGIVDSNDYIRHDPALLNYLNNANYVSIVNIITRFWDSLIQRQNRAVLVGFGSVASIKGRNFNVNYSASKRALLSFFESLRHAASKTNITVQFYILGYLNTNLSFGKKTVLPKAKTDILANKICQNLFKDFGITYYPRYWRIISIIIKMTPWTLFKRVSF
jgi:short-subunit dehydrogenase